MGILQAGPDGPKAHTHIFFSVRTTDVGSLVLVYLPHSIILLCLVINAVDKASLGPPRVLHRSICHVEALWLCGADTASTDVAESEQLLLLSGSIVVLLCFYCGSAMPLL